MSVVDNSCDCDCFNEGDWVECKLNTDVFGIVIGESDFGRFYNVQLVGSLEVKSFYAVTLRHMFQPETGGGGAKLPIDDDNVVDFTKERALRNTTTTRGAA
ncbi:hypothetical protein [Rhizobium rhizogenes]|uniref:hypothetical protein n=1 Tax=Rhizobium rhizogenes TaxID=359 RepID=UPI0015726873|nr:hypothetical protein [Rhizobium rhizogenes]NTF69415.1 hypothetical protein [Rhizobium rhizogenes]